MGKRLRHPLLAGLLGALLGGIVQSILNRVAGSTVVTEGALWGAVLAVAMASVPNFVQMGSRLYARGSRWQQVLVGVGAFFAISAAMVLGFLVVFSVIVRLFGW